jgi:alcohol dehydrogenase
VRFNAVDESARSLYAALARIADRELGGDDRAAAEALVARLGKLLAAGSIEPALAAHGVRPAHVPALAAEAAEQWTAQFNPRPVGVPEFRALFEAALGA